MIRVAVAVLVAGSVVGGPVLSLSPPLLAGNTHTNSGISLPAGSGESRPAIPRSSEPVSSIGRSPPPDPSGNESEAAIVAVAPNPVADGDRGEYLILSLPGPTPLGGWSIDDGESTATLPDRTATGRVILTTDPGGIPNGTRGRVLPLSGHLALSNGGETITLADGSRVVDVVRYGRAPEGHRYVRDGQTWAWRRAGRTDRPVVSAAGVDARVFVLPDAPSVPVEVLHGARNRILLAGYTFASGRVARVLCGARERGVRVRVLLEAEPVGGLTSRSAAHLDRLDACGVAVGLVGGEGDRYDFHHAKYAVVDDRAVVLTENWKPSGTGGRSSRGWGVTVGSPEVAAALAETFRADVRWRDVTPWPRFRERHAFQTGPPVPGDRYPTRFRPVRVRADRVDVLVAPDNAEPAMVALLDGANESIDVVQLSIGSPDHPFVRALFRAARRGVAVRVLVSGAWYVEEDNRALATTLDDRAAREGLPLEVRLAEPRSRFGKVHAKGVIVDGTVVAIGSANWNAVSTRENREVVLVLHGEAVGRYYARVFRADWRGGVWRLSAGVLGFVGALVSVALATAGGSIRFE